MSVSGIPETAISKCPVLECTRNVRFWYTKNGHNQHFWNKKIIVYQKWPFLNVQFWNVPEMFVSGIPETAIINTSGIKRF